MEKLVELSDHEIRIDFALSCKCRTIIRLKSLVYNAPLAFKVQTSSPHKFLVNPPSGLVPPLSSAAFQIVLKPQSHIPPTFPRSPSDRFLLKSAAAPDLGADSPESTQSELVNRWFNSAPHRPTFDVKLKVYFVGPFLLTHAVGAGDFEAVRSIIKRQRSIVYEFPAREAESLYRVAAQSPDIMGLLLEAGLKVEVRREIYDDVRWGPSRDKEGKTPLHLAASKGHLGSAEMLMSAGANVDARCKDGRTEFFSPSYRTKTTFSPVPSDVVKVLERGEAVLRAARRGELDVLESLLEKGADINFPDHYGLTPLHVAAIKGNKDAIMMLVEFGADVDCRDSDGRTPLHLAVQGGNVATVEILLMRGADTNAKTKKGTTPLYIARLVEYEDITRLLVDKGAVS